MFIGTVEKNPTCPLNILFRPQEFTAGTFLRWVNTTVPDCGCQSVGPDIQDFRDLSCSVKLHVCTFESFTIHFSAACTFQKPDRRICKGRN